MKLTVKRNWEAYDGSNSKNRLIISIGTHEVERIKNPLGYSGNWIVLKGTLIGASEESWRQWEGDKWDNFEVILEDK